MVTWKRNPVEEYRKRMAALHAKIEALQGFGKPPPKQEGRLKRLKNRFLSK